MPAPIRFSNRLRRVGRFLFVLAFSLATIIGSVDSRAQEISNGSFEQANPEGEPQSWSLQVRGLTVDLDDSATENGSRALKISGSGGSALVTQELDLGASVFSGATLRGRIRTREVAASATLVAVLAGPEGRIFMDDMADRVVRGDTEWAEYSIYIPGAEQARSLTVGALVIGSGTAWFDDLELVGHDGEAATDIDLREYVSEALSIMRRNYLHRDEVDWDAVRARGLGALSEGAPIAQAHAAVAMMVDALNDPHAGFFRPRNGDTGGGQPDVVEPVTAEMADRRIALVRVPAVPGSESETNTIDVHFADNAHRTLKSIDSPGLCGWIIDLRDNTGGNMWPMLAAIGPIAGPGVLGGFVAPEGGEVTKWIYRNGAALTSTDSEATEKIAVSVEPFRPANPGQPVAVLVSASTSSSGEATAIAFIGRNGARLFGVGTGGLATANNGYALSDGARIVIPIGYMADRHGNIHHPRVQPDEAVSAEDALSRATHWLRSQPACTERGERGREPPDDAARKP